MLGGGDYAEGGRTNNTAPATISTISTKRSKTESFSSTVGASAGRACDGRSRTRSRPCLVRSGRMTQVCGDRGLGRVRQCSQVWCVVGDIVGLYVWPTLVGTLVGALRTQDVGRLFVSRRRGSTQATESERCGVCSNRVLVG